MSFLTSLTASLLLTLGIGLVFSPEAVARAFRNPVQGAAAAGQAAAFAAQADDPSAVYYNPAGTTQLTGLQLYVGSSLIGGSTSFTGPTGAATTGNYNGSVAVPPSSYLYLTANLKDLHLTDAPLTAGIGLTTPFGLLYRYPDGAPFATAVTFASLPLLDIRPTLAWKLSDRLSLAIGADIYTFAGFVGTGAFVQKFAWPGGAGIPAGTPTEVNGRDSAAGFNVSLLYTPLRNSDGLPLVNIAFTYRSQATLHLTGNFLVNGGTAADTSTTLVLPQIFSGGIAVWPYRDRQTEWKLEADVDYTGWKAERNLDAHLSNGMTLPVPENWRNAYIVMLGTEYKWLEINALPDWTLAVRGGYMHTTSPVPDATFNPAVPDADQHIITTGFGLYCRGRAKFLGLIPCERVSMGAVALRGLGLDVAYVASLSESRTISGNINSTVNGTYHSRTHVGTVAVRVGF